jgi:hypothetical protein
MPRPLSSKLMSVGGYFVLAFFALLITGLTVPLLGDPHLGPNHPVGYIARHVPMRNLGGASIYVQPWAARLYDYLMFAAMACMLLFVVFTLAAKNASRHEH